jgi:hypothetical protein
VPVEVQRVPCCGKVRSDFSSTCISTSRLPPAPCAAPSFGQCPRAYPARLQMALPDWVIIITYFREPQMLQAHVLDRTVPQPPKAHVLAASTCHPRPSWLCLHLA